MFITLWQLNIKVNVSNPAVITATVYTRMEIIKLIK